jgi:hypothetical protein
MRNPLTSSYHDDILQERASLRRPNYLGWVGIVTVQILIWGIYPMFLLEVGTARLLLISLASILGLSIAYSLARYQDRLNLDKAEREGVKRPMRLRRLAVWLYVLTSIVLVTSNWAILSAYLSPSTLPPVSDSTTDSRFSTCREAKSHGFGPYFSGIDIEYRWYVDRDSDGVVCE